MRRFLPEAIHHEDGAPRAPRATRDTSLAAGLACAFAAAEADGLSTARADRAAAVKSLVYSVGERSDWLTPDIAATTRTMRTPRAIEMAATAAPTRTSGCSKQRKSVVPSGKNVPSAQTTTRRCSAITKPVITPATAAAMPTQVIRTTDDQLRRDPVVAAAPWESFT